MSISERYKGYEIIADPQEKPGTGQWVPIGIIRKETVDRTLDKSFSEEKYYNTREEAEEECMRYGKELIETEIKGMGLR